MGRRRDRLDGRLARATVARRKNSLRKADERDRRESQMREILQRGQLPYTPGVMSWLSDRLGKKSLRITADDVQTLLK